jgi:hypothetical protein
MKQRQSDFVLPQLVDLPTGNVHVLTARPATTTGTAPPTALVETGRPDEPTGGWEIHDGDGVAVKLTLENRAEALRYMCLIALRGISLPLSLYGPDGRPTGDRLA